MRRHLLVTNDYPPKVGGIQNLLWELYRRLDPDRVAVLTTPWQGDDAFDAAEAYPIRRSKRFWLTPAPGMVNEIEQARRDFGAEFVMVDPMVPLGLVGPHLSVPFGTILHGAEATIPASIPVLGARYRRALRAATLVVSSSQWVSDTIAADLAHPERLVLVPPGVDTTRLVPLDEAARRAVRRKFSIPTDALVIMSLSRLVPRKGMDRLIEATATLAGRYRGLQTVIVGSGRDEARLARLIRRSGAPVRLLGRVSDDDVTGLYGAADIFAMLCRNRWGGLEQEGFGIVFLEAAAAGIASVAGDSGGAATAVTDGETGLVVDRPDRVASVIEALDTLLANPGLRAELGRNGRRRAVEEFDYAVIARRYQRAIDDAAVA